jgi:hypothetical protein
LSTGREHGVPVHRAGKECIVAKEQAVRECEQGMGSSGGSTCRGYSLSQHDFKPPSPVMRRLEMAAGRATCVGRLPLLLLVGPVLVLTAVAAVAAVDDVSSEAMLMYAPAPALVLSGPEWTIAMPLASTTGTQGKPGLLFHSTGVYSFKPAKEPKVTSTGSPTQPDCQSLGSGAIMCRSLSCAAAPEWPCLPPALVFLCLPSR